jgi:UDP-N-acetyl-D-mannosaminuronate dehydrogenase
MKKIGILGYGEIGSSIEKCYLGKGFKIVIKDLNRDDGFDNIDVLNVCIPFIDKESFAEVVCENVQRFNPKLTIIHSTVVPETTKFINDRLPNNYIVHSPVRGVHPNLLAGLKTFVKYIGSDCNKASKICENHYQELGIKHETFKSSVNTELAKILSTTYYGVCIAFHAEMNKLCEKFDADFEEVCTKWNETYNEGYIKLGMANVVRPVLYPPGDKIGGHCVVPNAELVNSFFRSEAIDLILKYK